MIVEFFTTDIFYVVLLAVIMVISGYSSSYNLMGKVYEFLCKIIKNKKTLLVLLSAIGGILPIKGRVIVSAGLFDTLLKKETNSSLRPKFGILNYIATHHYYMWSPLEKTILIPMAVLNLSWLQMMGYTWPLLLICILALLVYISYGLRDIGNSELTLPKQEFLKPKQFPLPHKFIEWKTLAMVYVVILLGNYVKIHSDLLVSWVQLNQGNFFLVSLTSFAASVILGSSGKFAGIVALLCGIFGVSYLTYFMAIEFAGYLISPTHKCNIISMKYFGTPFLSYATSILIWCFFIVLCGIATILK